MGGGDVKIFAALALWVFPLGLFGLIICITTVGVLISLSVGAFKVAASRAGNNNQRTPASDIDAIRRTRIPYGPAIALGTLCYLTLSKNLGI